MDPREPSPTTLPLDGVRVLDLSRLLPGGFCTMLLSDFGADVLKVEDTGPGDYLRWWPPHHDGVEASASAAAFLALNRGKRSIRIDLACDAGRAVLLDLARRHDVLIESFRPGVLERLGIGWPVLRRANPGLVLCSISGYGQDGPNRDRVGHDLNYLGLTGMLELTGDAGGPPVVPATQIADIGGGSLLAAFAILAALRERDRSGLGQTLDVSMTDGALAWMAIPAAQVLAGGPPPRRGRDVVNGGTVCYRPYRCADGGWVTLGALEAKFWRAWCLGVGRADLVAEQFAPAGSAAHAAVEAIFAARTRGAWEAFAAEHPCCLEPIHDLAEALDSALVGARRMVTTIAQPGRAEPVPVLGVPVRFGRTPGDPGRGPAPSLGEHTDAVLAGELGYGAEQIAALHAAGAVAGVPEAPYAPFLQ